MVMATLEQACCLLTKFIQAESRRKQAMAMESCIKAYAGKFSANAQLWSIVGLPHDFDYDKYPSREEHSGLRAQA
jgi:predicted hydrolase (HD superfamily)